MMADSDSLFVDTIDRLQGSDRDVIVLRFAQSPLDCKIGKIIEAMCAKDGQLRMDGVSLIIGQAIASYDLDRLSLLSLTWSKWG